jgi:hypothetical protein
MEHDTTNGTELRLIRGRLALTGARERRAEMGERPIPEALVRLAREFARIKQAYRTPGML